MYRKTAIDRTFIDLLSLNPAQVKQAKEVVAGPEAAARDFVLVNAAAAFREE